MRLEARIDELWRRQIAFEDRILQLFSQREQAVGDYKQVRLVRTIGNPYYPEAGSGANVFPIVFVDGGFAHASGLQVTNFTNRAAEAQAYVCALGGQFLPEGSIVQAWQDRGTDASYPGEWWTIHRPCFPSQLVREVKEFDDQLVAYVWYPQYACDYYSPYVIADFTECESEYAPDDEPETFFSGEDTYDGWTGFDGEPDDSLWKKFDGAAYAIPEGGSPASGEYCIELPVTIGGGGGFVQFDYTIAPELVADAEGPLRCLIDGVEVFSREADGFNTAGPFALTPGEHTISFCLEYLNPSIADYLAKVENVTVWGT